GAGRGRPPRRRLRREPGASPRRPRRRWMIARRPPTSALFPYTTLFRSLRGRRSRGLPPRPRARPRRAPPTMRARMRARTRTPRRSEEDTSALQSRRDRVCRLLLEKKVTALGAYHGLRVMILVDVLEALR